MRISDWSSDVCSSDLIRAHALLEGLLAHVVFEHAQHTGTLLVGDAVERSHDVAVAGNRLADLARADQAVVVHRALAATHAVEVGAVFRVHLHVDLLLHPGGERLKSEEHTSELQSLMRISYAVFCLRAKSPLPDAEHTIP